MRLNNAVADYIINLEKESINNLVHYNYENEIDNFDINIDDIKQNIRSIDFGYSDRLLDGQITRTILAANNRDTPENIGRINDEINHNRTPLSLISPDEDNSIISDIPDHERIDYGDDFVKYTVIAIESVIN